MEILERYLYAIKSKLPRSSRDEIIMELRSLLMDNIESQYGANATESQVKEVIKAFGSPTKISREYGSNRHLIHPDFTDLYVLIIKIVSLAIFASLVIAFIVQWLNGQFVDTNFGIKILELFGNTLQGVISAIGGTSLVFMIITRVHEDTDFELDEEWSPNDLPELPKSHERVSVGESIAGIVFSLLAIVFFNAFPQIIEGFIKTVETFDIFNHTLVFERLMFYIRLLSVIWVIEVVQNILTLIYGRITKPLRLFKIIIAIISLALTWVMFKDASMYMGQMDLFGFRGILLIALIFSPIEIISDFYKLFVPSRD